MIPSIGEKTIGKFEFIKASRSLLSLILTFVSEIKFIRKNMVQVSLMVPWRRNKDEFFVWVQQRETQDELEGLWEFAGGKREKGETASTAAIREVLEEVGLIVKLDQLFELPLKKVQYGDKVIELSIFCYEAIIEDLAGKNGRWMKINTLSDYYDIPEISYEIIIDLLNYIES